MGGPFTPWALECVFAGGKLTGVDAEIAALDDCEPYGLAQYAIVSTTEMTGMKRRNPETLKFDIPVPRKISEVVFDPRCEDGEKRIAEARLIAAAPDMFEALEIAAALIGAPSHGFDGLEDDDEIEHCVNVRIGHVKQFQAALAKARGQSGDSPCQEG
jgi:hypothetical protein